MEVICYLLNLGMEVLITGSVGFSWLDPEICFFLGFFTLLLGLICLMYNENTFIKKISCDFLFFWAVFPEPDVVLPNLGITNFTFLF